MKNRLPMFTSVAAVVVFLIAVTFVTVGVLHATGRAKAASPAVAITGLHVSGNKLVNGNGQTIRLLGVDKSGAEFTCLDGGITTVFDTPVDANSVAAMTTWDINAVRVPLNEDCWLGINGEPAAAYTAAQYQQAIVNYVGMLNADNLIPILDLHWNAPGSTIASAQQAMPDSDHAPAFWTSVANTFKNNSSVIFDLYNEPHTASWSCWLNGGSGSNCNDVGFPAAGMQSLVNTVRATGATNPIMLGGLAWANDLSQWLQNKPTDPLNNLIASFHVYNFNNCNNTTCWNTYVAPVAAQVPIITGEMGENECGHSFIDQVMAWLDSENISYLAWTWNAWSCTGGSVLISDLNGTPTAYGAGYKAHLLALAGNVTPTPPNGTATPTSPASTPTATPISATVTPTPPVTPTPTPPLTPTATPTGAATATPTPPPTATPTQPPPTPTPSSGGNGVTATGVVASSSPYYSEEDVKLSGTGSITAMTLTITVQKTSGVVYNGSYFTYGGVTLTHTDNGTTITYTFTLSAGQTLPANTNLLGAAQFGGNGTAHSTTGDTWSLTTTSNGATNTLSGHF